MDFKAFAPHNIGDAIKMQREALGLTQVKLAELCGLSGSYISDIESGRTLPTLKTLDAIVTQGFKHELVVGWSEPGEYYIPASPVEIELIYTLRKKALENALVLFTALVIQDVDDNDVQEVKK